MARSKPTKRERIDEWLRGKKEGYKFYAYQIGNALGLMTAEVVPYLKWNTMVKYLGESLAEPNWEIVRVCRT
jgi:hypothetical protein